MVKKILVALDILGLLVSLIWLMRDQTLEALATSIGLIAALIGLLFSIKKGVPSTTMNQRGGKNSKNYQAKGDININ